MKKVVLAVGLIGVLAAGTAAAAGSSTTTFQVTADVIQNCTISATTLSFLTYDPLAAAAKTGTGQLTVTCTKSVTTPKVGLDNGGHNANATAPATRAMANGTNYLSYDLFTTSGYTTIWNDTTNVVAVSGTLGVKSPQTLTIYGQIPAGQDVVNGSYTDTITATVNF